MVEPSAAVAVTVKATTAEPAVITVGDPESAQVVSEKVMPVGKAAPPSPVIEQEAIALPAQPETAFAPLPPISKVTAGDEYTQEDMGGVAAAEKERMVFQ